MGHESVEVEKIWHRFCYSIKSHLHPILGKEKAMLKNLDIRIPGESFENAGNIETPSIEKILNGARQERSPFDLPRFRQLLYSSDSDPDSRLSLGVPAERNFLGPPVVGSLLEIVHTSFTNRFPICLSPEVIWFVVLQEIGRYLAQNPRIEGLWGDKTQHEIPMRESGKTIAPEGNDWSSLLHKFKKRFIHRIGEKKAHLLLPSFSCPEERRYAPLVLALSETSSSCCETHSADHFGVPCVRLTGPRGDWIKMRNALHYFKGKWHELGLYFEKVDEILSRITDAFAGRIDRKFFANIYKREPGRGDLVTGWFPNLFAYTNRGKWLKSPKEYVAWENPYSSRGEGMRASQFPQNIGQVRISWTLSREEETYHLGFIGGIFYATLQDSFLKPTLQYCVVRY